MKKLLKALMLLTFCVSLTSCASCINGTTQSIAVSSSPSGASVYVDGANMGTTPTKVEVKRKHDHVLTITKPGYGQEEVILTHVFSGAVAGNLIAGGVIGWGVDAMTGAQYRMVPEQVSVTLRPLKEGEEHQLNLSKQVSKEEKLQKLEELKNDGSITEKEYEVMKNLI